MFENTVSLPTILDENDKTSILKNRIRKNYKHVRNRLKKTGTNAFRIYDRDIKEYPLAIDFYNGRFLVHYFSSSREEEGPREDLQGAVMQALKDLFGANSNDIYEKVRIKREEKEQYGKTGNLRRFFEVSEYGVKFKVNLTDYLDTGLFLDHRETRRLVAEECKGKRLLNLFAYTCSFSVQAAVHGACFTKSVDMSNTYIDWGIDNFILNDLSSENNVVVREDCLKFLEEEKRSKNRYDVIVIDPPTLSRSKKMDHFFDIQVEYLSLISSSLRLLTDEGVIFFSTNSRKFVFDAEEFSECLVIDISKKTLPVDFHDAKIRRCWKIIPGKKET